MFSKQTQQRLILFIGTGGWTGYMPWAPGTWGSLVGVGIAILMSPLPLWGWILTVAILAVIGVRVSGASCRILKKADSPKVVFDEIVGFLLTMIGIPITGYWLVWGFIFFRFFDIAKLPPANAFDSRWKNGWGVVLDDIVAGIYGNILLHLMLRAKL